MFTCSIHSPAALVDIEVYEATYTVSADTGTSQSAGGELMLTFLKNCGQKFTELHLAVSLSDGQQTKSFVQKIKFQPHVVEYWLHFFLPPGKGYRTLLGIDFLRTSGIILAMHNNWWYFDD
ncbi:retrovirus-related Pol polyprotein from transposon 412 [Nephila pilipes]|uniref:Retrovirus-related Pol polyprotein from transposon 412 n=1 Tax=Nephila pilipes TaxID=299642 RepID=A0A8X6QN96_NEPPI|nr:retrovirus-related Pol polyprotein from transposon 412 [Nephila pilipes]